MVEYPCEESQKSGALNVKYVREGSRNGCNFLQWICAGLTPEAMGGEIIEDERVVNVVKQPGHERSTLVLGNSKDGIVSFMVGDLYLIANAGRLFFILSAYNTLQTKKRL